MNNGKETQQVTVLVTFDPEDPAGPRVFALGKQNTRIRAVERAVRSALRAQLEASKHASAIRDFLSAATAESSDTNACGDGEVTSDPAVEETVGGVFDTSRTP